MEENGYSFEIFQLASSTLTSTCIQEIPKHKHVPVYLENVPGKCIRRRSVGVKSPRGSPPLVKPNLNSNSINIHCCISSEVTGLVRSECALHDIQYTHVLDRLKEHERVRCSVIFFSKSQNYLLCNFHVSEFTLSHEPINHYSSTALSFMLYQYQKYPKYPPTPTMQGKTSGGPIYLNILTWVESPCCPPPPPPPPGGCMVPR